MNKKLKFIIAGVAIVAGLASAVSCQDLSKDVDSLSKRVSTLESTVAALQSKIDAGAVITNVTSTASGVKVTLSNGNTFDITNGKDGATGATGAKGDKGDTGAAGTPGSVVTIGDNGNWFIDGVDTGLTSKGQDGAPGAAGAPGEAGKDGVPADYYVPNPETGCFDKYSWDAETGAYVATPTEISYVGSVEGGLTAIYDPETGTLTLVGVEGVEGGVVVVGTKGAEAVTEVVIMEYPAAALPYNFFSIDQLENVPFGPNGEIEFVKKDDVERPLTYVIKVNPANAKINASDVSFINSKGEALDMLDITVEEYDDILVKSGENGLYKVTATLKKYDKEAFAKATKASGGNVAFALKVGDAITNYESTFGRTDDWKNADPFTAASAAAGRIMVKADENASVNITTLKNRNGANDYKWRNTTANPAPTVQSKIVLSDPTKATDNIVKDNRTTGVYVKVAQGKPIVIEATTDKYKAFYVTLDEQNVTDPSETVAWGAYKYTGLNTLCYSGKLAIQVDSPEAAGDIIGFRVFAVNWDGTWASPYGTAFYAILSADAADPDEEAKTVATVITPQYNGDWGATLNTWSATAAFDPKSVPGTPVWASATLKMDKMLASDGATDMNEGFTYRFVDKDGKATTDGTKIVGIQTQPNSTKAAKWGVYVNNMEYTGVLSIPNADGVILAKVPVSMKKVLPTEAADAIKKAWNLRSGVLNTDGTFVFEVGNQYATDAATIYSYIRGAANGRLRDFKVKQHAVDAAIAAGTDPTPAQLQSAAQAGLLYYYSSYDILDMSTLYTFKLPTAAEDPVFGGNIAVTDFSTKFNGAKAYQIFTSATGAQVTTNNQTATAPIVTTAQEGDLVDLVVDGAPAVVNIGIGAVNNQTDNAVVSYNYGAISLAKFGGKVTNHSAKVGEYKYQFRTKASTYDWKWNWNANAASTASNADINIAAAANDTGVAYTLEANAGITGSATWNILAPAHQARLNYIYYSVTQEDGGVVTDYIKNYQNWKPATGSGTGGAYTAADWRKDPFDVNMAPELIFTGAFDWDAFADWIYDEASKTKLSTVMTGTVTGDLYFPDDFAAAHYWGEYESDGTTEKAIDFRPAKLTSALGEEYYTASVNTLVLTMTPVATASAPLSPVASKLTLNFFDEYDNPYTIVVDVNIVP